MYCRDIFHSPVSGLEVFVPLCWVKLSSLGELNIEDGNTTFIMSCIVFGSSEVFNYYIKILAIIASTSL